MSVRVFAKGVLQLTRPARSQLSCLIFLFSVKFLFQMQLEKISHLKCSIKIFLELNDNLPRLDEVLIFYVRLSTMCTHCGNAKTFKLIELLTDRIIALQMLLSSQIGNSFIEFWSSWFDMMTNKSTGIIEYGVS